MKYLLSFVVILTMAGMACGFSIDIPSLATPGPEVTDEISVAIPKSDETRLSISFGAGKLRLSPGAGEKLVQGTATYNLSNFKPDVKEIDGVITISQGVINTLNVSDFKNEWDLKLGDTPMDLEIKAGAYEGDFEFGGLALNSLTIQDGASDVKVSFFETNLTEMSVFRYETGASSVNLIGLANANFSTLIFIGGAGDYTLDFGGELQQNATARIETGFGNLNLIIPKDVDVRVSVEGGMISVNHSTSWDKSNSTYIQNGTGPSLTIIVNMGAGSVTITD